MAILPPEYFRHHNVLFLSKDLLGKYLMTNVSGIITGGMIIETEAYRAPDDRASHAYGNKRTKRNATMFCEGGVCYVYQCYGIHYLFNIITNEKDIPHGILIRAIHPEIGIDEMLRRRNKVTVDRTLTGGPGTLTQALGINIQHNGEALTGPTIWVEDRNIRIPKNKIIVGPRVGVDYAGEDALLPWRFRIQPTQRKKEK